MRVTFTPLAEADLTDIALYIAQDNPERAFTFTDEIESRCLGLSKHALIGAPRPELGDDFRVLPFGRYLIFYRSQTDEVLILRVLHSARDIDSDDFT